MSQQFFRKTESGTSPPYTAKELRELALSGEISPDEPILCMPENTWVRAREIGGLTFGTPPGPAPNPYDFIGSPSPGPVKAKPPKTAKNPNVLYATLGLIALLLVGLGVWYSAVLRENEKAATLAKLREEEKKRDEELEANRKKIRDEVEELEQRKKGAQQDVDSLQQQRDKLATELKDLTSKLEVLNRWRGMELALFNVDNKTAVGLKQGEGGFLVNQKADGEMALLVLAACRKLHIPRTVDDQEFAFKVYDQVEMGAFLPPAMMEEMRGKIWKTHQFVRARSDTDSRDLDITVYRDMVDNQIRIGFLNKASKEGLQVEAYGASRDVIPWSRIQSGSARHGTPDTVLPMLNHVDYLEYAIMRVVQKVGTSGTASLKPRVLVQTNMKISEEHFHFYQSQDDLLVNRANSSYSFSGHPYFVAAATIIAELDRASIPARRKALWEEAKRTDPNRAARIMASYAESEVKKRLDYWGISAVTVKDLEQLGKSPFGDAFRLASQNDATHLLQLDIREPMGAGAYHLSVQLFNEEGKDVWTHEGSRSLEPEKDLERYHCSSGRLAIIKMKEKEPLLGAEKPAVVSFVRKRTPKQERCELVYLEDQSDRQIQYRRLFDTQLREVSKPAVEEVIEFDTNSLSRFLTNSDDTNEDLRFRYVGAKFAEKLLAPVGRVVSVAELSGQVSGLTRDRGIVPGERCKVLRSVDGKSLSVLPTDTNLGEVGESQGRVTFANSGFEDVNPDQVALKTGDLLLSQRWTGKSVIVVPPTLAEPASRIMGLLKYTTVDGVREKYEVNELRTSVAVANILADSLVALGVPAAAPEIGRPAEAGFQPTHRISGTITLSPRMNCDNGPASIPRYMITVKLTNISSGQDEEYIEFDYGDHIRSSALQR